VLQGSEVEATSQVRATEPEPSGVQDLTTQLSASAATRDIATQDLHTMHTRLVDAQAQLAAQQDAAAAQAHEVAALAAEALSKREAELKMRSEELVEARTALVEAESGAVQSRRMQADLLATRAQQVANYEKAALVRRYTQWPLL
jgi:hypothetical protein